jgi:hypothetical protein
VVCGPAFRHASTVQKTSAFLKSEKGNTTAELAVIAVGFVVNGYCPTPVIGLLVDIAVVCIEKCKRE